MVAVARAQTDATRQQIHRINHRLLNIEAAEIVQDKRLNALEQEISNLQNQLNQPSTQNYASENDLRRLTREVQDVDQKRRNDDRQILRELTHLEASLTPAIVRLPAHTAPITIASPNHVGSQAGYDYIIQRGNTVAAIARAYSQRGITVTMEQILAANPGVNPEDLQVGQKIFIPAPAK